MFIVAAIVFPQSFYQNNNEKRFAIYLKTEPVDSAKEKLKGTFLKNIEDDLFTRGQMAAYMNSDR